MTVDFNGPCFQTYNREPSTALGFMKKALQTTNLNTVLPLLIPAPQKYVNPKEKAILCLFPFGITSFLGAGIKKGNTVIKNYKVLKSTKAPTRPPAT